MTMEIVSEPFEGNEKLKFSYRVQMKNMWTGVSDRIRVVNIRKKFQWWFLLTYQRRLENVGVRFKKKRLQ